MHWQFNARMALIYFYHLYFAFLDDLDEAYQYKFLKQFE